MKATTPNHLEAGLDTVRDASRSSHRRRAPLVILVLVSIAAIVMHHISAFSADWFVAVSFQTGLYPAIFNEGQLK